MKNTTRVRRPWRWVGVLAVTLAAGATAWALWKPPTDPANPDVLVNLTSLTGRQAPPFTLADAEGASRTVTPGGGRPLVLVFHMGSI